MGDIFLLPYGFTSSLHWILIVVKSMEKSVVVLDLRDHEHTLYDSLTARVLKYLQEEGVRRGHSAEGWSVLQEPEDYPVQDTYYDCGLYVCMAANLLAPQYPLTFTAKDMLRIRQMVVEELQEEEVGLKALVGLV